MRGPAQDRNPSHVFPRQKLRRLLCRGPQHRMPHGLADSERGRSPRDQDGYGWAPGHGPARRHPASAEETRHALQKRPLRPFSEVWGPSGIPGDGAPPSRRGAGEPNEKPRRPGPCLAPTSTNRILDDPCSEKKKDPIEEPRRSRTPRIGTPDSLGLSHICPCQLGRQRRCLAPWGLTPPTVSSTAGGPRWGGFPCRVPMRHICSCPLTTPTTSFY